MDQYLDDIFDAIIIIDLLFCYEKTFLQIIFDLTLLIKICDIRIKAKLTTCPQILKIIKYTSKTSIS